MTSCKFRICLHTHTPPTPPTPSLPPHLHLLLSPRSPSLSRGRGGRIEDSGGPRGTRGSAPGSWAAARTGSTDHAALPGVLEDGIGGGRDGLAVEDALRAPEAAATHDLHHLDAEAGVDLRLRVGLALQDAQPDRQDELGRVRAAQVGGLAVLLGELGQSVTRHSWKFGPAADYR